MHFFACSTALVKRLRVVFNLFLAVSLLLPSFATILYPKSVFAYADPLPIKYVDTDTTLLDVPQANHASALGLDPYETASLQSAPLPTPSGALPPYPDNHTLDGQPQLVGTPPFNYDFEAAGPSDTGVPPTNFDLSAASIPIGTPPTNHDLETGDFTGWTTTGTVSVETNPDGTHWAKLASNGDLISSPFTVDNNAQQLFFGYGNMSNAQLKAYIRYGTNYANEIQVANIFCSSCPTWSRYGVNLVPYRGQSIQLRLNRFNGTMGIDEIRQEIIFSDYAVSGDMRRIDEAEGTYAQLNGNGSLTTGPFALAATTQYVSVRVRALGPLTNAYKVFLLSGPSFATETQLAASNIGSAWETIKANVSAWQGQTIKVKVIQFIGNIGVDDIGLQSIATPGWYHTDGIVSIGSEDTNHYLSTNRSIVSEPFTFDSATQQISLRHRTPGGTNPRFVFSVLHGPNFTQQTDIGPFDSLSGWQTLLIGMQLFAGQTVKIKLTAQYGTIHFDNIAIAEKIVPGWTFYNYTPIVLGEDSFGSYIASGNSSSLLLKSSRIDVNMLDWTGRIDQRTFAITYAAGLILNWNSEDGQSGQIFRDSSTSTGPHTHYFGLFDGLGTRGYFSMALAPGAKLYSIADNIARQQISEPFSQKVGLGIDTTTGNFGYQAQDLAVDGVFPIAFTRYYNAHLDQPGPLGYGWSHTYATRLALADNLAGVVMGSGPEIFFYWDGGTQSYKPIDVRIHDKLVKESDGTFTFTTKANYKYRFTSTGVLSQILDPNNNSQQLNYDAGGLLTSVVAPGNVTLTFTYDAGKLIGVTDPAGITATYAYNANDLVTVSMPDRGTEIYTYDHHRLTRVINANNELVVHNEYDINHRVIHQTDALSQTLSLQYGIPGNGVTLVTDPANNSTSFYFDRNHRTTNVVNPEGQIYSYLYDDSGNLETVVGGANDTWSFAYDQNGNLLSSLDPLGNPLSIAYTPQHLPSTITSGRGYVTVIEYDSRGNVTRQVDPLGNENTYIYDTVGNLISHTDPLGHTESYTYDAAGHRLTHTDPLNQTWQWTYNASGKMVTETDPLGRTTTYGYDGAGRLTSIDDALGGRHEFIYDPVGHLLMAEDELDRQTFWDYDERGLVEAKYDAANKRTTYSYDANRNMIAMTDPLSLTTRYEYDTNNRLVKWIEPDGAAYYYTYDANGKLLTATDPLSHTTTYQYDEAGRLVHTILPDNSVYTYHYDADSNLVESIDPLSRRTSYGYDALSRMITTTNALNALTTYTYDGNSKVAEVTNAVGASTSYRYDALGRPITTTYPAGQSVYYTYDALGNVIGITDALGRTETTTYDALYRLQSRTDAAGHISQWAYDAADQLTSFTASTGAVTTYTYDPRGWLTQVTDALNQSTTYIYDDAGRQTQVLDPLNQSTFYAYDLMGRTTGVTNPLGKATTYGYDAVGNQTSVTDPLGRTQTVGYDSLNRPVTFTDAAGRTVQLHYDAVGQLEQLILPSNQTTTYAYDAVGQLTQVTDALGHHQSYEYDLVGRVVKETDARNMPTIYGYDAAGHLASLTDALGGVVQFGYDAVGQMTSLRNPNGQISSYTYDNLGNLLTQTDPLFRVDSYTYDQFGRLSGMTDARGTTVAYGYDLLDRMTSVTYPGGVNGYGYDALNRLTSYSDATGATNYSYDAASHITAIAAPQGTVTYSYNDAGERTSMTLPGNRSVGYGYDNFGQLSSLTDWLGGTYGFGYNNDSQLTTLTRPGGITTNYGYDGAGRLNAISHNGPSGTLQNYSYTLDENGNRTAVTGSGGNESYTLDLLNRVTQIAYANGDTASYTYDADGNRLSETTTTVSGTTILTNTYDAAGQLLTSGPITHTYDANGNLLNAGGSTYTWDWANRLINANVGGNVAAYTYDANELRVGETVNGQAVNLLWDRLTQYPTLVDDGQASYLHGVGPLAQFPSEGGRELLLTDALRSVRGIADNNGALVGSASYDVFGAILAQNGVGSNFGFSGERFTPEVALLYLRARDLQVGQGRFLSADTVQPNAPGSQGYNLYAYVANNPTTWVDPSGHNAAAMQMPFEITIEPIYFKIVWFQLATRAAVQMKEGEYLIAAGALAMTWLILACINEGPCRESFTATANYMRKFGSDDPRGVCCDSPTELTDAPNTHPTTETKPVPTQWSDDQAGSRPDWWPRWLPNLRDNQPDYVGNGPDITDHGQDLPGTGPQVPGSGAGNSTGNGPTWQDKADRLLEFPLLDLDEGVPSIGDMIPIPDEGLLISPVQGPAESVIWQGLKPFKGKFRTNGEKGSDRRYYRWDYTHKDIEVYDAKYWEIGSADPTTGEIYRWPEKPRNIRNELK